MPDVDEFSDVSWYSTKGRNALRGLIADVAWEHGSNTPGTDRAMAWLRRALVRYIASIIIWYCCVLVLAYLSGFLAGYYGVNYWLYFSAFMLVGLFSFGILSFRVGSLQSWELGRTIIDAIKGTQGLVRNQNDPNERRRALRSIARIPRKYSAYVGRTVSANAPSRLRIAKPEFCRDEVLAILRLFAPTLYATSTAELVSIRDDLVRLFLRVTSHDLKSISSIGSCWPLPSMIADATNRSRRFTLGLEPSGAVTLFVLPLVIALIGALGSILGEAPWLWK